MKARALIAGLATLFVATALSAQERKGLPDVSSTFKGEMGLPVPFKNPLFNGSTESIGQLGGMFQFPISKGIGIGAGGSMTWFSIKERALAPYVTTGDIRRATGFAKIQYERYTGPRTFYELSFRPGLSWFDYDCPECAGNDEQVFYWSLGLGYYIHASENLAFGLTMAYDTQSGRYESSDLGLEGFPGRTETEEASNYQNLVFGLGFSTRLRRSPEDARGW